MKPERKLRSGFCVKQDNQRCPGRYAAKAPLPKARGPPQTPPLGGGGRSDCKWENKLDDGG